MTTVNLHVESPDTASERRYDKSITVGQLKLKLETVTGILAGSQVLTLCRSESDPTVIVPLNDADKSLESYGVHDLMMIKVHDRDPSKGSQWTDVSQVEKFELSPEEYAKRQDTLLAYKKANKIGRFADAAETSSATPKSAASHHVVVGSRCEVALFKDGLKKRGTVRFVGPTTFGTGGGEWIGVEYDEPVGKNDGSVEGERYFSCHPKHGGFVRPDVVTIGDFGEEELEVEEM